ncbi:MAG: serine/threonine protein kinase [Fibrobacteres bacterium]|nr:serine/threonine protein kinase [Fibrobacterota bacterium]
MTQECYGRYRILRPLGQGGMASVHLAEDPLLRRLVAIKILRGDLGAQPDWVRRFHDEATAIARLGSPNVVQVHDFGREGQEDYLVLEFVEGISLAELLQQRQGRLEPSAAAAIVCQAADGLRAAHEAGIIHRDIKPDNILIRRDGLVKIADFGIARLMEEVSQTRTGSVFGSPLFMSPEQVEGRNPSGAIDIFALAGVFFRTLTGQHPFEAEHAHAVMWKIVQEPAPLAVDLVPQLDLDLSALVASMHSKDPADRPRAAEVSRLIRHFLSLQGTPDPVGVASSAIPIQVRTAPPLAPAPTQQIQQPSPPQSRPFFRRNRRLLPFVISGIALVFAAFFAGKIWDQLKVDPIPESSKVDPSWALRQAAKQQKEQADSAPESDGPSSHIPAPTPAKRPDTPSERRISPLVLPPVPKPPPVLDASKPPPPPSTLPPRVTARMRDEAPEDVGSLKPRIAIVNRGPGILRWVRLTWKFPLSTGPAPVLDVYYAPQCALRLERSGTLVAECSGLSVGPGQSWPSADGMSLAIHHPDWRPWQGKAALGLSRQMVERPDIQVESR